MFNNLIKNEEVLQGLEAAKYTQPTEVQKKVIPVILEGKDIIVQSKTGTGKTASFAIPLLEKVDPEGHVQALVIVPTRELSTQVTNEFRTIGKFTKTKALAVYGGQKMDIQLRALQNYRNQIIVGTPGRLLDHIKRGTIKLGGIKYLILDEADRMLDMGFEKDLNDILRRLPQERQTLLFSATMPDEIKQIAKRNMKNPEEFLLSREDVTVDRIKQTYYYVQQKEKMDVVQHILKRENPHLAIIFCSTKRMVDILDKILHRKGFHVRSIHGGLKQTQRDRAMKDFKSDESQANILIATDIAARGLHIDNVDLVINYDVPQDVETYVHRIGRTGRMEKHGKSISLITPDNKPFLDRLQRFTGKEVERETDFKTRMVTHRDEIRADERPRFRR